ncbi:MAG: type II toxin-antitoxin system VapB family antitoxin [Thermoleophilia bacterium]|nr:type II toxin-antitoxin system VapB family antitoxin [Thermoleophilia bacterium]
MRTTLDIDDALLAALMERLPGATKTEAIETAIESYVVSDARGQLRELAGTIEIDDASAELRAIDRST